MRNRLANWLDDRIGILTAASRVLDRPVPGGARWGHALGFALAAILVVDIMTGLLLMTTYSPSSTMAWGSVYYITNQMELGWFVRGLHRYASFGAVGAGRSVPVPPGAGRGVSGRLEKSTGGWPSGRSF